MQKSTKAVFTQGPILPHILKMTLAGTIGLIAVFLVDVLNMFYIAQLHDTQLTAAIGFAGVIIFLTISFCIGMSIAAAALVSRALGAENRAHARAMAAANISFMVLSSAALVAILWPFQGWVLLTLGADGVIYDHALRFLHMTTPSLPLMGIGMACSAILRAVGDGKRSMHVTLAGGITTLILDPIFIFGFGMGLDGAAIVTVLSRVSMAALGIYGCVRTHDIVARLSVAGLRQHLREIAGISVPAVLTNIATPVGGAYVTYMLAPYGAEAVSAGAIVNRMVPLAFCGLFALSGAVGPMMGQNYGAKNFERLRSVLKFSFLVSTAYTIFVWCVLMLASNSLVQIFELKGLGADLMTFFCYFVAPSFAFLGAVFVANAAFNTLGKPVISTTFNWLRATLGTIPFVYYGGVFLGARGVVGGQGFGSALFGIVAIWAAFRLVRVLEQRAAPLYNQFK